MVPEETSAWILLITAPAAFIIYIAIILLGDVGATAGQLPYQGWLVAAFGSTIVITVIGSAVVRRRFDEDRVRDIRDDEIDRVAGTIASASLVIGSLATLIMALTETAHFWIANTGYLSFVLGAVTSSATKILSYRRGLGPW